MSFVFVYSASFSGRRRRHHRLLRSCTLWRCAPLTLNSNEYLRSFEDHALSRANRNVDMEIILCVFLSIFFFSLRWPRSIFIQIDKQRSTHELEIFNYSARSDACCPCSVGVWVCVCVCDFTVKLSTGLEWDGSLIRCEKRITKSCAEVTTQLITFVSHLTAIYSARWACGQARASTFLNAHNQYDGNAHFDSAIYRRSAHSVRFFSLFFDSAFTSTPFESCDFLQKLHIAAMCIHLFMKWIIIIYECEPVKGFPKTKSFQQRNGPLRNSLVRNENISRQYFNKSKIYRRKSDMKSNECNRHHWYQLARCLCMCICPRHDNMHGCEAKDLTVSVFHNFFFSVCNHFNAALTSQSQKHLFTRTKCTHRFDLK